MKYKFNSKRISEAEPDICENKLTERLSKQQKRFIQAIMKSAFTECENELPPSFVIRSCKVSFDELIGWSNDENFMSALTALYRQICVLDRFYVHSSLLKECANGNYQAMKVLTESCLKAEGQADAKAVQKMFQSVSQRAVNAVGAAPEADIEDIFSVRGRISEQPETDSFADCDSMLTDEMTE